MGQGESISQDPAGEPLLVACSVRDTQGAPIEHVKIDIWETDSTGHYDVQHADREGPDGRCVMRSDSEGKFWFRAIKPVPYPIPHDGPVGQLLKKLHRHPYRPSHMHFMFEKEGYDHLITYVHPFFFPFPVNLFSTDIHVDRSISATTPTKHPTPSSASRIPWSSTWAESMPGLLPSTASQRAPG